MQKEECRMQNTGRTLAMRGRFLAFCGLHSAFADLRGALCSKPGGLGAVWGRSEEVELSLCG
jgi:hypothetical protein